MFETKRFRGRLLAGLFLSALIIFMALNTWASSQASQRAESAEDSMRTELKRVGLPDLLLPVDNELSIPSLRSILPVEDGAKASSEVLVLWQYRCVVGHIDSTGAVSAEIFARPCS
jgi:hypothetical protein